MTSLTASQVSTEDRAVLRAAMDEFLAGKIDNDIYDNRIQDLRSKTKDPTVAWVVGWLWYFYSDGSIHKADLTKEGWDLHQRFLLLLDSGARVEQERVRRWHASQAVAAGTLLAGAAAWWWRDLTVMWWTPILLLVALAVAFFNQRWRAGVARRWLPSDPAGPDWAMPFPSLADVRHAYRLVPGFRKKPCPTVASRGQKSKNPVLALVEHAYTADLHLTGRVLGFLLFWMASPFWLVFQCLPVTARRERVVVPAAG